MNLSGDFNGGGFGPGSKLSDKKCSTKWTNYWLATEYQNSFNDESKPNEEKYRKIIEWRQLVLSKVNK